MAGRKKVKSFRNGTKNNNEFVVFEAENLSTYTTSYTTVRSQKYYPPAVTAQTFCATHGYTQKYSSTPRITTIAVRTRREKHQEYSGASIINKIRK